MKLWASIVLSVVFCASLGAQEKVYRFSGFSAVDVQTKIKARLVASNENKVVVQGENIDHVLAKEDKGRLVVRFKSTKGIGADPVAVCVYYNSPLTYIGASGDSEITAENVLEGGNIRIDAGKGAFVHANVSADTLRASIAAGGQIQTAGDVKMVEVSIKTGGQFNGYELVADDALATITAGGTAYVYALKTIKARVGMGGKVFCKGAANVDSRTTMGGSVIVVED